jgi:2-oxo-4-hydroxy-4-carboxy-5-ureidoimidazoline decarboxylase
MESWQRLDTAQEDAARALLQSCCGSTRWIDGMMGRRPFRDRSTLQAAARDVWFALGEADWREAFGHHPRIGDRESLQRRFPATAHLSAHEQRAVDEAPGDILNDLEQANRLYEEKFGYIFIVRASGRTAGEMLVLLRERLENDPRSEIETAAAQQAEITALRLDAFA